MINSAKIQKNIATEIKLSGMSQTKLAISLIVSKTTISRYKNGDCFPSLNVFANLCYVLDLDANEILCINKK